MFPIGKSSAHQTPLLGSWQHRSASSSGGTHDPVVTLASSCVRTHFGRSVQLVADCLQVRGALALKKLTYYLQQHGKQKCVKTDEDDEFVTTEQIRASLLVLIQHSVVTSQRRPSRHHSKVWNTVYRYHPDKACLLLRYPRLIEFTKKSADATAAVVVEELLVAGRLRTTDVVVRAAERAPKSEKYTVRQSVVEALCKLVSAGFVEKVPELRDPADVDDDEGETEWSDEPPKKRVKLSVPREHVGRNEDPAVVGLIRGNSHYQSVLPIDAVWRVSVAHFHDSVRAVRLGVLVGERHGHAVQAAGSLVTGALKYCCSGAGARGDSDAPGASAFRPHDVVRHLPKSVVQLFEGKAGGLHATLKRSWEELSELKNPQVVHRIGEDRYEIAVGSLTDYLRDRIFYQVVKDRHGEVAARVISILSQRGWFESDHLAEQAMIPAKDTREVLHNLYRSRYVDLFQLSTGSSRQYNPASTVYLWSVDKQRLRRIVTENVALALQNMRLRREHEVDMNQHLMERAQLEHAANELLQDKRSIQKFNLGLERLDVAVQQLDETFMALRDF
jgi:DNA-directed RNA polymerase III subunit RPC3